MVGGRIPSAGAGVIRIGHGNEYVNNKKPNASIKVATNTGAASWGWNEATRIVPQLARLEAYRDFRQEGVADPKDGNDCVSMVRKSLHVRHASFTQVCEDTRPERLAKDRVFTQVAYEHPAVERPINHINIHPNPINFLRNPNSRPPIVDEFIKSMNALAAMVEYSNDLGFITVVSGDFNLTLKKSRECNFLHMYRIFDRYKMNYRTYGIDGIAWNRVLKLKRMHRIGKLWTGSDHVWLVADLVRS